MADGGIDEAYRTLPVIMSAMETRKYVASIDLGTTYSGCAFGEREEVMKDPLKVNVIDLTGGGAQKHISQKTPTCILFDKNKEFIAFGHEAEEKYVHLASEQNEWDYFLLKRFKMMLYQEQNLTKSSKVKDIKKRDFPAFKVFSESIRYLRDQLLENCHVADDDIHWVLTVPAIWGEKAKQFMRQAAVQAGIQTDKLSLALEPEAASIYCKNIPLARISSTESIDTKHFTTADKYIVLDLGGGTTDITVHEVKADGTLKEITKVNGGEWGGTCIDENFLKLLEDVIGPDVMEILQNSHGEEFLELCQSFEVLKRTVGPDKTGWMDIRLPQVVLGQFEGLNNQSLDSINGTDKDMGGKIKIKQDKLSIVAEYFRELFKDACDHICEIVRSIFLEVNDDELNKILLVGGFGESLLMQTKLKRSFPDKTIVIPEDAGLAVLKGAVLFGFNPTMITSRVCRKTYGIQTHGHFEPALHSPERRMVLKGTALCKDTFGIHAMINQEFEEDEKSRAQVYVPSDPGQRKLCLNVLASDDEWPKYSDSPGVDVIGQIIVDLQDADEMNEKPIEVQMQFGKTELGVVAREQKTGKETSARYELLGGGSLA